MKQARIMIGIALAILPVTLAAQDQLPDVERELVARGAPVAWARNVADIVSAARADGLPTGPLVSKALEGWAKRGRVPPDRVLTVLNQLAERFGEARELVNSAGVDNPPGTMVAATAEALGRGMTSADVRAVIAAAPTPEAAATGMIVAGSLAAQGLDIAAAVRAVEDELRRGRTVAELLQLPSGVAAMLGRGVPASAIAQQILRGGGLPIGGPGVRPQGVPPAKGPAKGRGKRGN